eukprot:scaffold10520_cov144-Amphora_coffeaeformis.AAC.4
MENVDFVAQKGKSRVPLFVLSTISLLHEYHRHLVFNVVENDMISVPTFIPHEYIPMKCLLESGASFFFVVVVIVNDGSVSRA